MLVTNHIVFTFRSRNPSSELKPSANPIAVEADLFNKLQACGKTKNVEARRIRVELAKRLKNFHGLSVKTISSLLNISQQQVRRDMKSKEV